MHEQEVVTWDERSKEWKMKLREFRRDVGDAGSLKCTLAIPLGLDQSDGLLRKLPCQKAYVSWCLTYPAISCPSHSWHGLSRKLPYLRVMTRSIDRHVVLSASCSFRHLME